MSKLRRHDWRCHRQIECNICGELIPSRQDIKQHRELKHKMFRRVFCRYFPNCLDEEDCLFEHTAKEGSRNEDDYCVNGQKCNDQSCNFSEQKHFEVRMLCKFQANCNRLNCSYKHSAPRKTF